MIVDIPEAGIYSVTMSSSATISIGLLACDEPLRSYTEYDTQLDVEIEMVPGRKRLMFSADLADEAVGEVVLRGPLTMPVTRPPWSVTAPPGLPR